MLDLNKLANLDALKITLASPEEIRSWSFGEVTKPETINYRTFKPERDGLFDEKIFGPVQDYACSCGKYKGIRYKGVICDKCGVEVIAARVRRERMGHIDLSAPVVHIWYFKGIPSKLATLLDVSPKNLEAVIYFSSFILTEVDYDKKAEVLSGIEEEIVSVREDVKKQLEEEIEMFNKELAEEIEKLDIKDAKKKDLKIKELTAKNDAKNKRLLRKLPKEQEKAEKQLNRNKKKIESMDRLSIMTDAEYYSMDDYIQAFSKVKIGAEAIKEILDSMDLTELAGQLKKDLLVAKGQNIIKISKRLKIVEGFRKASLNPSWMITEVIAVTPPDLRPMVQLDGGRFATSDLNDLYRRVINRNNRLKKLLNIGAPDIIVRNEKRMLQESVDALIDANKSRRTNRINRGTKQLKSLSDMIKGKQGRFRQNLLGKRVDYSGRAVIVVGPELKINECGVPKKMAVELFKPFILRELLMRGHAPNIKTARILVDDGEEVVWDVLEDVVKERPVLLNRAPTLHKLGIQGFYPKLIEGNAIRLHPLVVVGFNADFDGDQMAIHLPISEDAVNEIKTYVMATQNFLKPAAGDFVAIATRDMYLGTFYLTKMDNETPRTKKVYTKAEALMALQGESISLTEAINYRIDDTETVITSAGRILTNEVFPEGHKFVNTIVEKNKFKDLAVEILMEYGTEATAKFLDAIKTLGFLYGTKSGLSVSISDVEMIPEREDIINEAEKKIAVIEQNYFRGLITKEELRSLSQGEWIKATDELDVKTWDNLEEDNPMKIMVTAGAGKASQAQIKQIGGMKGLVQDPNGRLVDLPIRSNYRLGLSGFECFNAARGARKGLTDKGLKTADAGYLTRRLVDVAQDVVVHEIDCGSTEGRVVRSTDKTSLSDFSERVTSRYLSKDALDPAGKVVAKAAELITKEVAEKLVSSNVEQVEVRSPLTCQTKHGICAKCYGHDLSTKKDIEIGTAAGIIAAQAIGEPGTQLTMKTFHSGGIAGKDITSGLPRVEEIFEARSPKATAVMAEISGKVKIEEKENGEKTLKIVSIDKSADLPFVDYNVDPLSEIVVKEGQLVNVGDALTLGYLNLNDLFNSVGIKQTEAYIIEEIQKVYSSQGVLLDDKHLEIMVKQMFSKAEVVESGDSEMLRGEVLGEDTLQGINESIIAEGGTPAKARVVLLGISKSSLKTDSFLSAASFQETVRVLTDAATRGLTDELRGLKENVIIGRKIPVGTGYQASLERLSRVSEPVSQE
ncbi:DNA-directed RNA polymerase subunit beta' [bacterium]|nr:DNA-directed RNA polymerase subunit beta' [bacterium]